MKFSFKNKIREVKWETRASLSALFRTFPHCSAMFCSTEAFPMRLHKFYFLKSHFQQQMPSNQNTSLHKQASGLLKDSADVEGKKYIQRICENIQATREW